MANCPKCGYKLTQLFTSWACDACDGLTAAAVADMPSAVDGIRWVAVDLEAGKYLGSRFSGLSRVAIPYSIILDGRNKPINMAAKPWSLADGEYAQLRDESSAVFIVFADWFATFHKPMDSGLDRFVDNPYGDIGTYGSWIRMFGASVDRKHANKYVFLR